MRDQSGHLWMFQPTLLKFSYYPPLTWEGKSLSEAFILASANQQYKQRQIVH